MISTGAASAPLRPHLAAAEQPRDLFERPLRRREADALERPSRLCGAPPAARAKEQVGAALGGDDRMNLVDDDRLDRREHLARLDVSIR